MGVPAYFRKLDKKYRIVKHNIDKPIKSTYIDGNCLIHPQCFAVLDANKDVTNQKILFKKMCTRIVEYIDYIIRLTNPTDLVYIAIDGVAPLAKINQQRMRRFGYANNYRSEIYKKHSVKINDSWSNIVVTPGTQFMYELHKYIKAYYKSRLSNNTDPKCTYKIIYSSYLTPGEGEHKILQHLKQNTSADELDATIIYGLDADLIFLAMASQIPNIYLLRESSQFNRTDDDNNAVEQELLYADIDFAKQSINAEFNEQYKNFITNKEVIFDNNERDENTDHNKNKNIDFVNDYIFICYFLGNDFLPHLPSIDINMEGLEIIFNVYMDVFQNLGCNIITRKNNKASINDRFLKEFITLLASKEEDFFRRILPTNLNKFRNKRCFEASPHKREVWNIENLKNVKINDVTRLGEGEAHEWKFRYYEHYFKTTDQKDIINRLCQNYVEGLLWVARYYFEQCPSWRWQYKFTHAPFLSDLMEYLKGKDVMSFAVENNKPLDMYTQLVSVVPSIYSDILPESLKHFSSSPDSPIIDMFPLKYDLDMINKTQLYKCVPMIPYLDEKRVEECVKTATLNKNDKLRMQTAEEYDLGRCA